jgi:hypothetical protein
LVVTERNIRASSIFPDTMAHRLIQLTRLARNVAVAVVWVLVAASVQAWTPGRQVLRGHVPDVAAHLKPMGDLPETNRLHLAISLPLRHQDALARLLHDLYDPASGGYRKFLKPQEFADQFGPSQDDYQTLIAFAQAHHFQILHTHANRILLDVAASPAELQEAFHVNMKTYRHPFEARTFYAPDAEPSVESKIPLLHISGLDNYDLPHPWIRSAVRIGGGGAARTQTGSGPGGNYLGSDFRAAYAPGVTLDGAGQSVALVEFDTYYTNDILAYERLAGIAPVPITNVIVDGFSGKPGANQLEVHVDIEVTVAMAPGLSQVLVYEAPGEASVNNDLLNQIAVDDLANQVSCSWGFEIDAATDQIFQEMAAQGQSFFNACGDYGAYSADMGAKEGDPFITQVGGSELTTTGPGGAWKTEIVWPNSSGGVSATYLIPYWQQAVNMSSNKGSTIWRNSPDVALTAVNITEVSFEDSTNQVAGTSCSAPLWAAFIALANQQAAQNGQPPVGFLNPAIYAIGQSSLYPSCFHDITAGNNVNDLSTNKYYAMAGFDLCTGWGTPAGQALINALAPTDSLVILPAGGLSFGLTNNSTAPGVSETLVLTNSGNASVSWSLEDAPAWVQFSASNGIVAPGSEASLTVTTTADATNLTVGGYLGDLTISNLTGGVAHDVPIFLGESDPLILSPMTGMSVSGPVGGPFNMTSQIISLSNASAGLLHWTVASGSSFLVVAPTNGTLMPGQVASVTAALSTGASNLLINAAAGGISFADQTTGFTQTLPFTLAVGNGGFETGDFSDWTMTGDALVNFVGGAPDYYNYVHTGAYAGIFGEPTNVAMLSQTLPTTPAQPYLISFWLDNPVGGNPNEFEAAWNGVTLFAQTNMPKFLWTNMEFAVTATSAATSLEFSFQNKPDAFGLDDVSVTAIAPPAFATVAVTNGSVLFNWSALPGYSYQLQYATNLDLPMWINSGSPIVATNGTVEAEDATPVDPQRYYRLILSPP